MKDDLEVIANAVELARLKLANLKSKCPDDAKRLDMIEDIEMGLKWVARKLQRLQESK